jgi:hypothetical protein
MMIKRRAGVATGVVALDLLGGAVTVAVGGGGESRRPSAPFAWLHPSSPPAGWKAARTAAGASFAYPPGWRPIKTDTGTASVALLASWSRFRPQHNSGEGSRHERLVASTTDGRFRAAHGSCVIDTYAPDALWDQQAATLERAMSTFVP